MRLVFTDKGWEDYQWFQSTNCKLLKRLLLIKDCLRDPYDGIGKPERLKEDLSVYLSRRISEEHRLVYKAVDEDLIIVACRYHYGD